MDEIVHPPIWALPMPTSIEFPEFQDLYVLSNLVSSYASRQMQTDDESSGLNLDKIQILMYLQEKASHPVDRTRIRIAEALGLSKSTCTSMVKLMIADGWLLEIQDGIDERRKFLSLAPSATTKYHRALVERSDTIAPATLGVSAKDLRDLGSLIARMTQSLRSHQQGEQLEDIRVVKKR